LDGELSLYDGIAGNPADVDISDPLVSHFYIPNNIDSIRFSSGAEILVAAYTRPDGMTREVRVLKTITRQPLRKRSSPDGLPCVL